MTVPSFFHHFNVSRSITQNGMGMRLTSPINRTCNHPSWSAAGVQLVNFSYLWWPLNFWQKNHAKWAKLTFISLIISDRGKKKKIPSCHDLDTSINHIPMLRGLHIWLGLCTVTVMVGSPYPLTGYPTCTAIVNQDRFGNCHIDGHYPSTLTKKQPTMVWRVA